LHPVIQTKKNNMPRPLRTITPIQYLAPPREGRGISRPN
jgi:hypothetical protein